MQTAPSKTRSERSTSKVKSAWPGVSIRLIVCGVVERGKDGLVGCGWICDGGIGGQEKEIAAD